MNRLLKIDAFIQPYLNIFINNRTMSKNIAQKRKQFFPIGQFVFREYLSGVVDIWNCLYVVGIY